VCGWLGIVTGSLRKSISRRGSRYYGFCAADLIWAWVRCLPVRRAAP